MLITHTIDMELRSPEKVTRIQVKQGDSLSRYLELNLFCDGEPWAIPGDATAVVRYHIHDLDGAEDSTGIYDTLPDGSQAWNITENVVHISLIPGLFSRYSIVRIDVVLVQDARILATANVEFYVNYAPCDGTEPEAQDYYSVVTLDQINTAIDDMRQETATVSQALDQLDQELYQVRTNVQFALEEVQRLDAEETVSPTVAVADIEGGSRLTITDIEGKKTVDVMDGAAGKSAYGYAAAAGYAGTETEFGQSLAAELKPWTENTVTLEEAVSVVVVPTCANWTEAEVYVSQPDTAISYKGEFYYPKDASSYILYVLASSVGKAANTMFTAKKYYDEKTMVDKIFAAIASGNSFQTSVAVNGPYSSTDRTWKFAIYAATSGDVFPAGTIFNVKTR